MVIFLLKVQRIFKNREWPMSQSGKYKDNLNFSAHYGAAEKNDEKVKELLRKIKKKVAVGFSVSSSLLKEKQKFKC